MAAQRPLPSRVMARRCEMTACSDRASCEVAIDRSSGRYHRQDALDRLGRVRAVNRGKNLVAGVRGAQGHSHRLAVAQLAHQDHVRDLAARLASARARTRAYPGPARAARSWPSGWCACIRQGLQS